jgi:hypothetical protein
VRIAIEVIHNFQYAAAPESLERFGERRLEAHLRIPERAPHPPPNLLRKALQVVPAASHPAD